ncbi:hypothetical protein [Streptomyces sp. NPDC055055]
MRPKEKRTKHRGVDPLLAMLLGLDVVVVALLALGFLGGSRPLARGCALVRRPPRAALPRLTAAIALS